MARRTCVRRWSAARSTARIHSPVGDRAVRQAWAGGGPLWAGACERPGPTAGVDADDELAGQVLGRVGHQPILADDEHEVLPGEQEARQVRALDLGQGPLPRDGGQDLATNVGMAVLSQSVTI